MLEIDSDTVETHMALGALFRRRGEMDRAIRIHQNLIARPHLPKEQRTQALLALGQDYLRAGLLDRAERLFLELEEMEGGHSTVGLHYLLDIYQQQKSWEPAIVIANKLNGSGESIQNRIAHYNCELAQIARAQGQLEKAQNYLNQALEQDPACVRASLLQGELEVSAGKFANAVQIYQRVKEQDPDYLTEIIAPLTVCYEQLGDEAELVSYLHDCLQHHPRISIILALSRCIQRGEGEAAAATFIAKQLQQRPSLRGLHRLITLHLSTAEDKTKESLLILQELIINLLKNKPIYRCIQCGFNGKILHWLCPSCKNWNTMRPIQGVEGD
jgi:lipopolysaccharide biosynthesis regulator YciM